MLSLTKNTPKMSIKIALREFFFCLLDFTNINVFNTTHIVKAQRKDVLSYSTGLKSTEWYYHCGVQSDIITPNYQYNMPFDKDLHYISKMVSLWSPIYLVLFIIGKY